MRRATPCSACPRLPFAIKRYAAAACLAVAPWGALHNHHASVAGIPTCTVFFSVTLSRVPRVVQFEKSGEGIIVTSHDKLAHYLGMLTHQIPIESQFKKMLADNLNAEASVGDEGVGWKRGEGEQVEGECGGKGVRWTCETVMAIGGLRGGRTRRTSTTQHLWAGNVPFHRTNMRTRKATVTVRVDGGVRV
eukprot:325982-Chlamydomonas_euryale.AAC.2